MTTLHHSFAAIVAVLVTSGCLADPPVGEARQQLREHQGTHLLGDALDGEPTRQRGAVGASGPLDLITAPGPYLEARRGPSVFTGSDPELIGAQLTTDSGVELRINAACPHARPPSGWRPGPSWSPPPGCATPGSWTVVPGAWDYVVDYRDSSGAWQPLCGDTYNRALPIPGEWTETGDHVPSVELMSWSCWDGTVSKCLNWGYDLWSGARGWELHQACTRMAVADYCALGESHTLPWTPVDLYDAEPTPINTRVPGFAFEAAWHPDKGAICIARARWRTFEPGGPCPLPDPRMNPNARFCEDYGSLEALVAEGAIIFNDSLGLDRGLYRWHDPVAGEWLSSSRFYDDGLRGRRPPSGAYSVPAIVEGTVFSPSAPRRARVGAVALESYRHGLSGDVMTTTGAPPPGYVRLALEGYIYPVGYADLPDSAVALYTYRRLSDDERLTTIDAAPAGYVLERHEGYLLH